MEIDKNIRIIRDFQKSVTFALLSGLSLILSFVLMYSNPEFRMSSILGLVCGLLIVAGFIFYLFSLIYLYEVSKLLKDSGKASIKPTLLLMLHVFLAVIFLPCIAVIYIIIWKEINKYLMCDDWKKLNKDLTCCDGMIEQKGVANSSRVRSKEVTILGYLIIAIGLIHLPLFIIGNPPGAFLVGLPQPFLFSVFVVPALCFLDGVAILRLKKFGIKLLVVLLVFCLIEVAFLLFIGVLALAFSGSLASVILLGPGFLYLAFIVICFRFITRPKTKEQFK